MKNGRILEDLREILALRPPRLLSGEENSGLVRAGVVVPLFDLQGTPHVLLIRRSMKVPHHKGQISFPGGRMEPQDASLEETALREAQEEIGLKSRDVELLGRIDDARTVSSGFLIQPVVGIIPHPYPFILNPAEVAGLLAAPLEHFGPFPPPNPAIHDQGKMYPGPTYIYRGEVIWGATARILMNLARIIHGVDCPLPLRRG
ncbi:MAG: CoA pyrophosphatase [Deltaproteobacteria bacterium]|nr:CoA pyrophosphatase [Deltaproteobacteria bacterium]